jgi:4-amino-4-deoxy-L-arabinose transferase-like glycosyltransferase
MGCLRAVLGSALVARVRANRHWQMLAAIAAVALVVRVAAIVATGATTLRFGDAQDYVGAAGTLCDEGRYPDRGSLPFFRAPGLPLFLALTTFCHPRDAVVAKLALALCDVGTVLLTYVLVLLVFGTAARRAALLAAVLAAIDPLLVLASSDVTTEPLATVLLTGALCALLRARRAHADDRRALAFACAGGVALGLACLTRPGSLAVAPVWLALPVAGALDVRTRRRADAATIVLASVLGLAATLAPWTLRNALHFGEPILVNDAGGYNAWRGTHPLLHDMLSRTSPARFADDSRAFEQDLARDARQAGLGSEASPREREGRWWSAARTNLAADSPRAVRILTRNAAAFFRPWLDPAAYGPLAITISAAWFVALGALALRGAREAWRRDRAVVVLLAAGVLLAGVAHLPFQTVLRFRLPFTEPLLLCFAAAGAVALYDRLRGRESD